MTEKHNKNIHNYQENIQWTYKGMVMLDTGIYTPSGVAACLG